MNISIEIGGPLADAINRLADALVSAKQADTVIEKASTKARSKKAEQTAPEAPAPAPVEEAPAAETAPEAPTGPTGPTRDDAKKAVLLVAKEKGHEVAAGLLAKFGAAKISEVKDEDIPAIIAAAKEL